MNALLERNEMNTFACIHCNETVPSESKRVSHLDESKLCDECYHIEQEWEKEFDVWHITKFDAPEVIKKTLGYLTHRLSMKEAWMASRRVKK